MAQPPQSPQAQGIPPAVPIFPFFIPGINDGTGGGLSISSQTVNLARAVGSAAGANTVTALAAVDTLCSSVIIYCPATNPDNMYLAVNDSASTPLPLIVPGGSYQLSVPAGKQFNLKNVSLKNGAIAGAYTWSIIYG